MKIRPLFSPLVRYPTAKELAALDLGDRDMRHPDDRTSDPSRPEDGETTIKTVLELAEAVWNADYKHD